MTQTEALKLALEALEMYREYTPEGNGVAEQAITAIKAALEAKDEPVVLKFPYSNLFDVVQCPTCNATIYTESTAPQKPALQKSELGKDAVNLLFALHDAWPYVHQHCTIESKKKSIQAIIVKHGEFADLHLPPPQRKPLTIEQPKVRTGDCLLVGVCASEGHKIQPQRTWVGLTAEEREQVQTESYGKVPHHVALIAAVEARLKEKNT